LIAGIANTALLAAASFTDLSDLSGESLFWTLLPGFICSAWPLALLLVGIVARFFVGWRSHSACACIADVILCTGITGSAWLFSSLCSGVSWMRIIDGVFHRFRISLLSGVIIAAVVHILLRRLRTHSEIA
jgi:hypothetical protein